MNPPSEGHLCLTGFEEEVISTAPFQSLRDYDELEPQLDELDIDSDVCSDAPYRGSFLLAPARVFRNLRYDAVSLSMAARYIFSRLRCRSNDLLRQLIPYHYGPGKRHGRRQGKYRLWDMRLVAGGKEGIVEELQRRTRAYEIERLDTLLTQWDLESSVCVYFVGKFNSAECTNHIIFSNKQALDRIHFRSFLDDCRALERSAHILQEAIDAETVLLQRFLDTLCTEAVSSHREKVVRIPEIYKVAL